MTKWLIICILTLQFMQTGLAQQGWFVGIGAEPRHTWLYNKHDYMYNVTRDDIIDIIITNYPHHIHTTGYNFHYMRPVHKDLMITDGFQFNLHGGYAFDEHFRVSLGVGYESFYMHYEKSGYTTLFKIEDDQPFNFLFYKIGWPENRVETLRERLHYLSFPLQFQYQFGTSTVKPFVEIGAVFRWLANYSLKFSKGFNILFTQTYQYYEPGLGKIEITNLHLTKNKFDIEGIYIEDQYRNPVGPFRSNGRYENIFYNALNVALNLGMGVNIALNNQWQLSLGVFGTYSPLSVEKKYRDDAQYPPLVLTSDIFPDGIFPMEIPFLFMYPVRNYRQKVIGPADWYPDILNRNGWTPHEERGRTVPISLGFQIGLRWFFEEW